MLIKIWKNSLWRNFSYTVQYAFESLQALPQQKMSNFCHFFFLVLFSILLTDIECVHKSIKTCFFSAKGISKRQQSFIFKSVIPQLVENK